MDINVKFTYHTIGQGLFYTGRIGGFNFIYDCGSENKERLNKAILHYKTKELSRYLNLLIISHFHDDHTVGLGKLLNNLHVDTVVLPYLTPIERLTIALQKPYLPASYNEFYEFLSDPVVFLFEKKVKKIIIIGGTEGEKQSYLPEQLPPNKPKNSKIKWAEEMKDDEKLKKQIKEYENSQWSEFINSGKLFIKSHYRYVTILNGFWIF